MTALLNRLKDLTNALGELSPIKEEYQKKLDTKFRLEFNYNSNHLEGNTLTYSETELLLIFDETRTSISHQYREYEEMKAHDVAFALIKEWATDKERPLTEASIKNLNEIILVRPFWKDAITTDGQNTRRLIKVGDYKELPNSVRLSNGEIFDYTSPGDTPIEMGNLISWFREEEESVKLHPIELAALLHYRFVRIHPFDDGNGRISRLLINYVLLRNNLPPIVIKSSDKKNYLQALHEADTGNLQAFIDYITRQLVWSLELSIRAAKGEKIDEPGDLEKRIAVLKLKIGENPDSKILQRKSKDSIMQVIEESILPFLEFWEDKLKSFDVFFLDRSSSISTDIETLKGRDMSGLANHFYANTSQFLKVGREVKNITIGSQAKGLRKGNKDVIINCGDISVSFFDTSYEVNYLNGDKTVNKLYDQKLSQLEIQAVIDNLGLYLIGVLEAQLS